MQFRLHILYILSKFPSFTSTISTLLFSVFQSQKLNYIWKHISQIHSLKNNYPLCSSSGVDIKFSSFIENYWLTLSIFPLSTLPYFRTPPLRILKIDFSFKNLTEVTNDFTKSTTISHTTTPSKASGVNEL